MAPTYSFEVNPALSLVTCRMAGFYEPADVVKFAAARDLAHQELRCGPNRSVGVAIAVENSKSQTDYSMVEMVRSHDGQPCRNC